ncbi:hypothetical protein HID58_059713, partial [Brassica napus]
EQKMEGRVSFSPSHKIYQRFKEGEIYHIRYFNLLPNNQRYKLTVHPYIININETTIITQIRENIPPIPSCIFRPHHYTQLISLASATNFFPVVRLTIWDNEAANFRRLNRISTRKNQIVIITSIIPRLHEEKLSLTTTPGSRFYFDSDINIIQRFQKRNKLRS